MTKYEHSMFGMRKSNEGNFITESDYNYKCKELESYKNKYFSEKNITEMLMDSNKELDTEYKKEITKIIISLLDSCDKEEITRKIHNIDKYTASYNISSIIGEPTRVSQEN